MKLDVEEVVMKILENWLQEKNQNSIQLVTEDIEFTLHIFCDCLDQILVDYQVMEDSLVIGNKRIRLYDQSIIYR